MSWQGNQSSIPVKRGTLDRMKELEPFESLSHDEFLNLLMDMYEEQGNE